VAPILSAGYVNVKYIETDGKDESGNIVKNENKHHPVDYMLLKVKERLEWEVYKLSMDGRWVSEASGFMKRLPTARSEALPFTPSLTLFYHTPLHNFSFGAGRSACTRTGLWLAGAFSRVGAWPCFGGSAHHQLHHQHHPT